MAGVDFLVGRECRKLVTAGFFQKGKSEAPSQPSSSPQKVPEPLPIPSAQQYGLTEF